MQRIKAIQTKYDGRHFRSRLEARWAVYFNHLCIEYMYEPEGFKTNAGWYLPDFYLPWVKMWAEVKPRSLTRNEIERARALVEGTGRPLVLLVGEPAVKLYDILDVHHLASQGSIYASYVIAPASHYVYEHRFDWEDPSFGKCSELDEWDECYPAVRPAVEAALSARFGT